MIAVSYHDRVNVLQGKNFACASPFDRPDYFTLLEECDGKAPFIALARSGVDCAALALMREGGALVPLANWYNFTWRPLATAGTGALALFQAIACDLKRHGKRVILSKLPDEDGSANLLQQAFIGAGWAVFRQPGDTNHILSVNSRSYADYIAGRPGALRTTLKRKTGKLDIQLHTNFELPAWQAYEEIYHQSWKPEEGNPAMLRRFAQDEGAAGRLRLALALHEGKAVAAQFWSVENRTAYIHKLAHLEDCKKLSAGTVLSAALFEQVIDSDKVELIDFGTGNDHYKADWMEHVRPRFTLDCHRPFHLPGWPHLARATLRHLATGRQHG